MTENTWQAVRAFTRSTVCVKSPVDRITVVFPLLSLEDGKTYERQNHAAVCEISDGRQSPWRLEMKYSIRNRLFIYFAYVPFCGMCLAGNTPTRRTNRMPGLAGRVYRDVRWVRYFRRGQVQQKSNLLKPVIHLHCPTQWPSGLRRESAAARLLGLRV